MMHKWRVSWTIARRDYAAAVFSRLFLLFLLLPLILAGLGVAFGAVGAAGDDGPSRAPRIAVTADRAALEAARARLAARLGGDALPEFAAAGNEVDATLAGGLERPRLRLAADAPGHLAGEVGLIVDVARQARAGAVPPASLAVTRAPAQAARDDDGRVALAKGVQYATLILTVMLAGRLLSSFIEERSNKVIEVLAAAVPVDAIFVGKLVAMLMFSLTCVAGWGVVALAGAGLFAPALLHGLGVPAVGWWAFVPLSLLYFSTTYLLLGAVLLGLGAQANSPADVQTLAFPTTLAQLALFAFASLGIGRPDSMVALGADLVPWSSALAMAARAAERPALWPHLLALAWQALWVWLTVRLAAGRFRRAVLKTGGGRGRRLSG